jgi:AcrR family transcriptional regulator
MEMRDKMGLPDRRVGKTRKAIFTALNELLQEKKFAKITVQEIIDRADIGRATFYAHFPTKDDVLIGYVEGFFESFSEQLNGHMERDAVSKRLPVAALFAHVQDNEKTISGIFMSESGTALIERFKRYWLEKIRPIIEAHIPTGQNSKIPVDILTSHVVNTIIGLIVFWLQDGQRYTPEQMELYFYELIYPVLSAKKG